MTKSQILRKIQQEFSKNTNSQLLGVLFFGSRVKFKKKELDQNADYDIGVIYEGKNPQLEIPDNWDLFLWSKNKWQKGFALQVELVRYAKILYDPEEIIQNRFKLIQEKILPHWLTYLKKF
ncbi:MAG: hypothetical protein ACK4UJ_07150 [Leptonema sp. (in: bacteria)]